MAGAAAGRVGRGCRPARLGASLTRQTMLCDLINAQTNVLEHNVSVEVVLRHKRSAIAYIATASDLVRQHVPELGDGARPVSITTLILAGALSSYCRPSASALAAYEADPTVLELRLDLRTALESAVATLIAGTLARSWALALTSQGQEAVSGPASAFGPRS